MAEDVVVLLDYIGWTAKHDVHVVGVSLGGMIAQGNLIAPIFNTHVPDIDGHYRTRA